MHKLLCKYEIKICYFRNSATILAFMITGSLITWYWRLKQLHIVFCIDFLFCVEQLCCQCQAFVYAKILLWITPYSSSKYSNKYYGYASDSSFKHIVLDDCNIPWFEEISLTTEKLCEKNVYGGVISEHLSMGGIGLLSYRVELCNIFPLN